MMVRAIGACWWALAVLLPLTCGAPTDQQVMLSTQSKILSTTPKIHSQQRYHDSSSSMLLNITFDDVDLTKSINETISDLGFMHFERFQVINATAANLTGMIAPEDVDCAMSAPNAIRSIPSEYANPSIIRSNATKLNAIGMSEYFDLISFAVKPVGPVEEWTSMYIAAWTIDGDEPTDVQEVYAGWVDGGYLPPWDIEPREWFEEWGEGVNWIELGVYTELGEPLQFFVDNILIGLHEL